MQNCYRHRYEKRNFEERKHCFKCLKPGHIKKNCRTKIKSVRCKAEGNHHTALCYPQNYSQHPPGHRT